jgi:transposase
MDIHKKYTVAVAMDEQGKVLRRDRIAHGTQIADVPWEAYLKPFGRPHVALEASSVSHAVIEAIEPHCESVTMAHPWKTALIAKERVKTDGIDGEALGHLLRTQFLPKAYILPQALRDQRELLRHRQTLVQMQTGVKNRMHAMLTRCGYRYEGTDLFAGKGRRYLETLNVREPYAGERDRYLRVLDTLGQEIRVLTRQIIRRVELTPAMKRLTTLPGIGKYRAALIYWEIADVHRFARADNLVAYAGLAPSVHSSGGRTYYGPIMRQGNTFLRWALVQAAQKYGKHPGPLGDFFRQVAHRKGAKKAKVACARKLAVIIWHMLYEGRDFDEHRLRNDRLRSRSVLDEAAR